MRAASERPARGRSILAAAVVAMAAIAAAWLAYELYRLIASPASIGPIAVHPGGIDLKLPHLMVNDWFAGLPVYTGPREGQHPHPPASMAILWPVYGGPSIARATAVYLLVTLASLAWIVVAAVRESRAASPLERALVALVPLATYPAGATIGNGQTTVYALAAALGALLLLRYRPPGRGRDLAAAALLLVAMGKPSLCAPFVLLALVLPGGARPVALLVAAYVALTLFAASFQPLGLRDQFGYFLAQASRIGSLNGAADLHALVTWLGVPSTMAAASAGTLVLLAWWLWRHRHADFWLLAGVTAIAARFWTYHRWYDDLLIVLPLVALFRLAKTDAGVPRRVAGALFALTLAFLLAPGGLYLLPPPWVVAYVGVQAVLWLACAGCLAMAARRDPRAAGPPPGAIAPTA